MLGLGNNRLYVLCRETIMKRMILCLVMVILLVSIVSAGEHRIVFVGEGSNITDTHIRSQSPSSHYEDANEMRVGNDNIGGAPHIDMFGLIQWNETTYSFPPGSIITSVKMQLHLEDDQGFPYINVTPVNKSWEESVSWNDFDCEWSKPTCMNKSLQLGYLDCNGLAGTNQNITFNAEGIAWFQHLIDEPGWEWDKGLLLIGNPAGGDHRIDPATGEHATASWRPRLYVNYTTPTVETTETPTIVAPSPADNAHNNTNVTLNITHPTVNNDVRYYLYFGNTTPLTEGNYYLFNVTRDGNEYKSFLTNVSDGTYYWKWKVQNISTGIFSDNTTERTLIIDTVTPTITLLPGNNWDGDNTTILNPLLANLTLNLSFNDEVDLYQSLINLSYINGTSYYVRYNTSITADQDNFSTTIDIGNFPIGNYTLMLLASDSHTAKKIEDYKPRTGLDYIRYETAEGNTVRITSETMPLSKKTTRHKNKYDMEFNYLVGKAEYSFIISSDNKLEYIQDSKYSAHFVVMANKHEGNWIDLVNPALKREDYTVTKIDDYNFEVKVKANGMKKLKFSSIGGLNVREEHYKIRLAAVIDAWVYETLNNTQINATVRVGAQSANSTSYLSGARLVNITRDDTQISITSPGYAPQTVALSATAKYHNLTFNMTAANAVVISFYDESTNQLILNRSFDVYVDNGTASGEYTSTDNPYTILGLSTGGYELRVGADDYDPRWYSNVPILSNDTTTINGYLINSTISSSTTFTIIDKDNSNRLQNVLMIMRRQIDGNWTILESKYSDVTGDLRIYYQTNIKYYFELSKEGYLNNTFFLNPIISSTYTIRMTPTFTINISQDYDRITLAYSPTIFYDGRNNNFTWTIQSPYSELIGYGYDLTYPGGTTSESGSTGTGSSLNSSINIVGAGNFSTLRLDYWYNTTISGSRDFTFYYNIIPSASNNTLISAGKDPTYGMGLFERLFIVVIIALFIAGIATMTGQPLAGAALALFIFGFFVYIQFIPIWSVLMSIAIGLLMLGSKSGG